MSSKETAVLCKQRASGMLYKRSDVVPQLSSGLPDIDLTNNYSDNRFGQIEDGGFVKQRLTFDLMASPIFLKM